MSPRNCLLVAVVTLALTPTQSGAAPIVTSASGPNAGSITAAFNAFQAAVGNPNNGNAAGPLASGRREINWDGGGVVTTTSSPTPFNGFQNIRGASFTTPGTGFLQATPAGLDTSFGRADGLYNSIFDPFTSARVFTPVGSTITDATFFVPGTNGAIQASVSAFGAIFLDVDQENSSSLQFFDVGGASLGTFQVPSTTGDKTFSFLGVQFNAGEQVGRVRIITGNQVLGATNNLQDQVALDDFIFAEPLASVPEPTSLAVFATGVAGLTVYRLRKKRAV